MSRHCYNEDGDHDSNYNYFMWQQAVRQATWGKRGQAFLREMRNALQALPEKRLIAGEFQNAQGEVCAIATVLAKRGIPMDRFNPEDDPHHDNEIIADQLNIATALVREIEYENDDTCHGRTPEERYQWMCRWVDRHLYKEEAVS